MTYVLYFFYPTASATVYGQRPKFFLAEHWATAEDENCAYGPTLVMNIIVDMDLVSCYLKEFCFFRNDKNLMTGLRHLGRTTAPLALILRQ